jgi:hypothetical protein
MGIGGVSSRIFGCGPPARILRVPARIRRPDSTLDKPPRRGGGARITEKLEKLSFRLSTETYSDEQKGPVSRVLIFAVDRGRAIQREVDKA